MQDRAKLNGIVSLSSFGIFLVVFGHSYADLTIANDGFMRFMYFIRGIIYSFHMPLFMFISGFLFIHTTRNKEKIGYAVFIKNKFMRLLVPYFVLSAAAFAERAAFADIAWKNTEVSFRTFLNGLAFPLSNMNTFFWFLPTLFIIFLAAPIIHITVCRWKSIPLVILITSGLVLLNIYNPFVNTQALNIAGVARQLVYFWLGCILYAYRPKKISNVTGVVVAGVLFLALVYINLLIDLKGKDTVLAFAAAVCGILFSCIFIKLYSTLKYDVFAPFNGISYQIYLLSWFFQVAVRVIGYTLLGAGFFPVFALMLFAGFAGPVLVVRGVRRYAPAMGFIFGMSTTGKTAGASNRTEAASSRRFSFPQAAR